MASTRAATPPLQAMPTLVSKLYDADSDIRFMSLTDLQSIFTSPQKSAFLSTEYNLCAKAVDGLIHTLNDSNGEVQNLAIKCLGPFVNRVNDKILCPMIDRVGGQVDVEQALDQSIRALALRAIVVALPRPTAGTARTKEMQQAYEAISRVLIPRLIGYNVFTPAEKALPPVPKGLLVLDLEKNNDSNAIDVLTEIARCFGPMLRAEEIEALQKIVLQILEDERISSGLKKKAVVALSVLANYFSDMQLSAVISQIIEYMRQSHATHASRKLHINILSSMARAIPSKFGPHLRTLSPFVLSALSQEELDEQMAGADEEEGRDPQEDEVREAALLALESFLSSCPGEMQRYFDDSTSATLRFLKFDPNVADADDATSEDEADANEDDELEMDEDFEADEGADDEDDVSWKVRRCAAKTLYTLVSVQGMDLLDNATTFDRIIHALIDRFHEREESVRVEVLLTLSFLIRKIGELDTIQHMPMLSRVDSGLANSQQPSRKRRRGHSDVSLTIKASRTTGSTSPETRSPPRTGPPANLAQLSQDIYRGLLKLLKNTSVPTKQAVFGVLKDLIIARRGGAEESLPSLAGPIVEILDSAGSHKGTSAAAGPTVQEQALQLTSEIAKTHSSTTLQSYLPQIVPAVIRATKVKSPKLACEALITLEQLSKVVTPPRSAATGQKSISQLGEMYTNIIELVSSRTADLTVRQQAIQILGTILGRTMAPKGEKMISPQKRKQGLDQLLEASKNETTRTSAIRAITAVAEQAPRDTAFSQDWFSNTVLELSAQLRKADRTLRSSSLTGLRTLIVRHPVQKNLTSDTSKQLAGILLPLLTDDDLPMLGPLIVIIASMVKGGVYSVDDTLISQLSGLLRTPASSSAIDSLCTLMVAIGESGQGQKLMQVLLKDVGVAGPPAVVGRVVGALLVSGGAATGLSTRDLMSELKSTTDDKRKSLALSVFGETGLRSGQASQLSPDLFTSYFTAESTEVPLNAAIALGRAAAGPGNLKTWVPAILSRVQQRPQESYLILHSIKELLQHNENDQDVISFTGALWDASVSASESEDSKTIGAECIANLTLIDPRKFMPALQVRGSASSISDTRLTMLQALLGEGSMNIRSTAILAFRDVFTISDISYDQDLRPVIVDVLTTMMRDAEVDNRRSSLNTFNAAVRNKIHLIMPHITQLLPLVIDQTFKDPNLIREVQMGPFKHQVDDGLEVRKVSSSSYMIRA